MTGYVQDNGDSSRLLSHGYHRAGGRIGRSGRDPRTGGAGAQHPDRYTEVFYEDLHTAPEATTAKLLQFLGVDDSEASVEACLRAGSFDRLSGGRQRGDEQADAFYRKGTVGDWRNHFDDQCVNVFMQQAGATLTALGYEA